MTDIQYRKIGLLGGTFDPIHMGHITLAKLSRDLLDLDIVFLVVANDPYQKSDHQNISNAWARYRIARAAIANEPKIMVSPIELNRKGKSYTIDTVLELKSRYTSAEIFMIAGSDLIDNFKTWEKVEQLGQLVTLVIFERKPPVPVVSPSKTKESTYFKNQIYLKAKDFPDIPQISSSELKELILNREDTGDFLNKETIRALEVEKLYNKFNEEFRN